MHIHDTLQSLQSRPSRGVQFFGSVQNVFTALLCYAKITPAALHRGNFANRNRENGEALGGRLEFRSRDFSRPTAGTPRRAFEALSDPKLSNACPRREPFKQAADG
jgi:hypothetical protein